MKERNGKTQSALKATLAVALLLSLAAAAAAQTASTTYRGTARDPFTKYKPALKRAVPKKALAPVPVPPIQARIDAYKAQKLAAMNMQQPAQRPSVAGGTGGAAPAGSKTDANALVEVLKALAASASEQQQRQQDSQGGKGDGKP